VTPADPNAAKVSAQWPSGARPDEGRSVRSTVKLRRSRCGAVDAAVRRKSKRRNTAQSKRSATWRAISGTGLPELYAQPVRSDAAFRRVVVRETERASVRDGDVVARDSNASTPAYLGAKRFVQSSVRGLGLLMKQAVGLREGILGTADPGRCRWVGMNQAFGLVFVSARPICRPLQGSGGFWGRLTWACARGTPFSPGFNICGLRPRHGGVSLSGEDEPRFLVHFRASLWLFPFVTFVPLVLRIRI
jgi:hypothetical protein